MYVFEIIFMYVCTINDVEPGFQATEFDEIGHTTHGWVDWHEHDKTKNLRNRLLSEVI